MASIAKVCLLAIVILTQNGCNNQFLINIDTTGNKILHDSEDNYYYVVDSSGKEHQLRIVYKGRQCPIFYLTQNKDNDLVALKVSCIPYTTHLNMGNRFVKIPKRVILLVSGKRILYIKESPGSVSLKWIKDKLLIIFPHQKILIDSTGKIVSSKIHVDYQLKDIPSKNIN